MPESADSAMSPVVKNWNVMVYMAADNSLSEECVFSLKEMQRIGSSDGVSVTAQFHSSAKGADPRRYLIRKVAAAPLLEEGSLQNQSLPEALDGDKDGELELSVTTLLTTKSSAPKTRAISEPSTQGSVAESELVSASDPKVLLEFIQSTIKTNSAEEHNKLVILSGHGAAAHLGFLRSDHPADSLAMTDLHDVFKSIRIGLPRNLDIVLMDSCMMSTAEVAHQLHGAADYLIGAEGFELSTGWPYHRILETLNLASQQEPDARKLALDLVQKYVRYYSDYDVAGVSVDQAVCDLKHSPLLVKAVEKLAAALSERINDETILNAVLLAHWRAQSYNAEQYVDLWDFCSLLLKTGIDAQIQNACKGVIDVIDGNSKEGVPQFVLRSCYSGAAFQHSHGLSIYFPWAADTRDVKDFKDLQEYRKLKFHEESYWGDFIEKYLKASQRGIRNFEKHQGETPLSFIPTDGTRTEVRSTDPPSRGGGSIAAKVKNLPVEFFRDECP